MTEEKQSPENATEEPAADIAAQKKCDEIISDYTYAVTHDLNAPLRHIIQYGTLLKEEVAERLGPNGTMYVNKLIASTERLRQLVNDLLSYAEIIHIKEEKQDIDLNKTLAEARERLSSLIEENHAIINAAPLPTIDGYYFRMLQIFYHLIRNAINYRSAAEPVIAIEYVDTNTHYLFSVRDNGQGIPEKLHTAIFKALKRLHSNDQITGSGLGLSICEKAVMAHGGRIWVEANPAGGSVFFFTIPCANLTTNKR